jgi:hypothetical protein
MPFGDPGAYWALLAPGTVELRRTSYDLDAAAARIASTAYPHASEFEVLHPPRESEMLKTLEAAALQ